jgi:hypothetical protein
MGGAYTPVQFCTSPPLNVYKPRRSQSPPPKLFHMAAAAAAATAAEARAMRGAERGAFRYRRGLCVCTFTWPPPRPSRPGPCGGPSWALSGRGLCVCTFTWPPPRPPRPGPCGGPSAALSGTVEDFVFVLSRGRRHGRQGQGRAGGRARRFQVEGFVFVL